MQCWVAFCCLLVIVSAQPRVDEENCALRCSGEEYNCIDGRCYCAAGYILNLFHTSCIKCPGLGEKCYGRCCKWSEEGASLQCVQGTCQYCYDTYGNWACRDPMDRYMMVTISQVAMGSALVLGLVATLLMIYKMCATKNLRARNSPFNEDSRLSIGSLQVNLEQRLRDAPPRYTRTPPPGVCMCPAPFYVNSEFVHDSSLPPPMYTDESTTKNESSNTSATIHM